MPGKLWHRVPDESGKPQLKEVDLKNFKIERPTIVYLSGFLTNNDKPGFVAGSIKRIEELLRSAPANTVQPDIYAWSHKGLSNLFNLAAYDTFPSRYSSKAGHILSASILMPLVAEGFAVFSDGAMVGRPLPPEEAAKNLRNITFFGYSAGSIVAQETFNATKKMMTTIGFTEWEVRDLMKEVVLIAAGCISRPTKETDRYTSVIMAASNDRINRFKNWAWGAIGTARRTIFSRYTVDKNTKSLSIRPLSASNIFVNAAVRPSLYEWKYDEERNRVKKDLNPLYPSWTLRRSYHELPHYVTTDDTNNEFSRIALYATVNAINRTGKSDPTALLAPPPGDIHDSAAQDSYRARIAQALKPMPVSVKKLQMG